MRDRQPAPGKENRVRITQDNGQVVEGVLAYADDATQEGSAYCKANVLTDGVCDVLGINRQDGEPADAFAILSTQAGSSICVIRTLDQDGLPVSGSTVKLGSNQTITNAVGCAAFAVATGTYSLTVRAPIDYGGSIKHTDTVTVASVGYTVKTYTATYHTSVQEVAIDASGIYSFSARVKQFDVFAVGAGASGGACVINRGTPQNWSSRTVGTAVGGGSGKTATRLNITPIGVITIDIGAGGTRATANLSATISSDVYTYSKTANGSQGGNTVVRMAGEVVVQANGGSAGQAKSGHAGSSMIDTSGANGGSGSGAAQATYDGLNVGASGGDGCNGGESYSGANNGGIGQGTTTAAFGSGPKYSPAGGSAAGASTPDFFSVATGSVAAGGAPAAAITTTSSSYTVTATAASVYGDGGGGALIAASYRSVGSSISYSAYSSAGKSGVVLVRWRV